MRLATVINTNLASLNAQRQLQSTSSQMFTAFQRLSSGLRINSAKDDAAGLSIAERMTTQVRGLNQGIRNIADAVSIAQTVEGGLDSIANNLQRMRELAVQSANFTNTALDREALQQEVSQLREEIQRVAVQTRFNGQAVLDGSVSEVVFQAGANVGETIAFSGIADMRPSALGVYMGVDRDGFSALSVVTDAMGGQKTINVNGAGVRNIFGDDATAIAASINALGISGLHAYADRAFPDKLSLAYSGAGNVVLGNVTAPSSSLSMANALVTANKLSILDITYVGGANKALLTLDAALASVNTVRSGAGAAMNRFEAAISAQRITAEAQTASRSRIEDADFAQETAALTRAQILQQSGMAILSQANALPQNVLSLLR